ncbi:MAG: bifunctional 2-C-methyl-D-erythritol 4-phosphate cytidylyltransferase/2-C-methyl-D-erythritol 2,4-cyclodiphosphate synthase [Alphaproteobacteria bacterium]
MTAAALIVAAGKGTRARAAGDKPKQYLLVGGKPVLTRTLAAFLEHKDIAWVQPVIHAEAHALYNEAVAALALAGDAMAAKLLPPVVGGANRQQSVMAGLTALEPHAPSNVLIHDGARPFVGADVISGVLNALAGQKAALAAIPVSDTLKAETDGLIARTVDRNGLWRAQTPQGFDFIEILAAHKNAQKAGRDDFTDDTAIAEWQGLSVAIAPGAERNIKLTTPEDFKLGEKLLSGEDDANSSGTGAQMETRIGSGFDVHAFEPGNHLWLCGVRVPHDFGLNGHSDADVALHALTDALLGAIGAGDIGQHFPPSDARWKGAASSQFLAHALELLRARGGRIINVDITIICERPKVGPFREAMRARIKAILGVEKDRVSVKATTTEGLGFAGRREGIAAMASVSVAVPA